MTRPTASRRSFMQGAAAAATAGFFVANQRSYAQSKSPNEKIQIAWIGVGGKGSSDVDQAGNVGQVVAICDTDENILGNKAEKFPDAEQFTDYRELIDKLGDKVDAIGVSTPDHNHFPAAMLAAKKKKHLYVQKPLTYTVWEARQLREAAKKAGIKTQMGNQGSATPGLRRGVETIQAGIIGNVKEIHVWTNRPVWPQAPDVIARPPAKDPPKNLHWDNWLGPAPERPYGEYESNDVGGKRSGKGAYHAFNWRGWWDFGTGALGDMACHTANLAFAATKLGHPLGLKGECGDLNPETYPSWGRVTWDFPNNVKFHWYEGRMLGYLVQPDKSLFKGVDFSGDKNKFPQSGALVIGEKGALFQTDDYGDSWRLLPEERFKDQKDPEQTLKRFEDKNQDQNMKIEWAQAIRGEIPQTFSNFDYAGMLTETVVMGNIAIRLRGQDLKWDGEGMKFTNNEEANKYLRRTPRSGWDVTAYVPSPRYSG